MTRARAWRSSAPRRCEARGRTEGGGRLGLAAAHGTVKRGEKLLLVARPPRTHDASGVVCGRPRTLADPIVPRTSIHLSTLRIAYVPPGSPVPLHLEEHIGPSRDRLCAQRRLVERRPDLARHHARAVILNIHEIDDGQLRPFQPNAPTAARPRADPLLPAPAPHDKHHPPAGTPT